jgi:hypothetical protein
MAAHSIHSNLLNVLEIENSISDVFLESVSPELLNIDENPGTNSISASVFCLLLQPLTGRTYDPFLNLSLVVRVTALKRAFMTHRLEASAGGEAVLRIRIRRICSFFASWIRIRYSQVRIQIRVLLSLSKNT